MAQHVILNIQDNQGYAPDQVASRSISLKDLLSEVTEAIERFGEDAQIVLSNGQQYGAGYGYISKWSNVFEAEEPEEGIDY